MNSKKDEKRHLKQAAWILCLVCMVLAFFSDSTSVAQADQPVRSSTSTVGDAALSMDVSTSP